MTETKRKMLVVDDDTSILRVLSRIFAKKGFIVDLAENGRAAKEKIITKNYDLALIDLRLPDIDGTDLLSLLPDAAVKIIFTGLPNVQNNYESQEGGADAFLVKPVTPEALLCLIERKFNEKREILQESIS
jgi:DNA-binding response OmpR family regulator